MKEIKLQLSVDREEEKEGEGGVQCSRDVSVMSLNELSAELMTWCSNISYTVDSQDTTMAAQVICYSTSKLCFIVAIYTIKWEYSVCLSVCLYVNLSVCLSVCPCILDPCLNG